MGCRWLCRRHPLQHDVAQRPFLHLARGSARQCVAVLVAFVQVFGEYYLPDLALAFMYLVMLLVLVVRPGGLLGEEA